jgi:glutamate synthase domain-containing protein 3
MPIATVLSDDAWKRSHSPWRRWPAGYHPDFLKGSAGRASRISAEQHHHDLEGDANDYFGKDSRRRWCVSAGSRRYKAEDNIIIGNVALYGATDGEAFIRGPANDLPFVTAARPLLSGVGDHGCEYDAGTRYSRPHRRNLRQE